MEADVLPEPEVPEPEVLEGLDPTGFESAVAAVERARRRHEVWMAEAVAAAEHARRHRADGHRTITAWARATFNWGPAEALRITRNGRALAALANLRAAARRGDLSVSVIDEFGRVYANPRCRAALEAADEVLTGHAASSWFADFADVFGRWAALADADGAAQDHREAHERRAAKIRIAGAEGVLAGQCATADAVLLREILDRFVQAEFAADRDEADADGQLARTHRQRAFDALKAIFLAAADASPGVVGTDPLVSIVLDQPTAEDLLRRLAGDDVPLPSPAEYATRRCETIDGVPLSHDAALAALLLGRLRGVLTDPSGVVIHLGRTRRLFTGGARQALLLQALRCLYAGCDIPNRHSQADHLHPWAHGGATDPANGAPTCGHHNRWRTKGYTTRRRADGSYDTYRPDGTLLGHHFRPPPTEENTG